MLQQKNSNFFSQQNSQNHFHEDRKVGENSEGRVWGFLLFWFLYSSCSSLSCNGSGWWGCSRCGCCKLLARAKLEHHLIVQTLTNSLVQAPRCVVSPNLLVQLKTHAMSQYWYLLIRSDLGHLLPSQTLPRPLDRGVLIITASLAPLSTTSCLGPARHPAMDVKTALATEQEVLLATRVFNQYTNQLWPRKGHRPRTACHSRPWSTPCLHKHHWYTSGLCHS